MHDKEAMINVKKLTVLERYNQEQIMKGKDIGNELSTSHCWENGHLQKVLKQLEDALLQAHQSVKQAQLANPAGIPLQQADQRLQFVSQQLQQLKTATPEMSQGLPKATQQQLTQLDHQIQQASGTLQLILKSISTA